MAVTADILGKKAMKEREESRLGELGPIDERTEDEKAEDKKSKV